MQDLLLLLIVAGLAAAAGATVAKARAERQASIRVPDPVVAASPPAVAGDGAMVLLDVDGLGVVNGLEGFDAGDRLLGRIEDALARVLPDGADLERLENARFAVWMPGAAAPAAMTLAEEMRRIAGHVLVPGRDGDLGRSASAGVTVVSGREGRARALLQADGALARAKALGGDRAELSTDPAKPPALPTRSEVAEAIARAELAYHLQPICDIATGEPVGAEALLRWRRSDGEMIGPDRFVDQLARIPAAGADLIPDLAVSAVGDLLERSDNYVTFNVTGPMIDGSDEPGAEWLRTLIARLPPERLVLEIVESAIVVDHERSIAVIEAFRAEGIRIALDDFGTGLSNLDRLRRLPCDILKVDRAFIAGVESGGRGAQILSAMADMAVRLNLDIVAEGIETQVEADAVRALGIRYGQGWLFGRPAPDFAREA